MKAPLPENEAERLAALRELRILDTPPELAYDELSALAAHICQTLTPSGAFVRSRAAQSHRARSCGRPRCAI